VCFTLHVFQCFLPYFMSYNVIFFIFFVCQFSRHIPGPTVCVSHIPPFSVFSPQSRSYSVFFSFSKFFSFLAIFQLLLCTVLIFHVFSVFLAIFLVLPGVFHIFLLCQFSCHMSVPTVCISHFLSFSVFSPQSRSYSVCVTFCTFLRVSRHIPGPTVCNFHF